MRRDSFAEEKGLTLINIRPAKLPTDIPSIVSVWFDVSLICHDFIDPAFWEAAREPMQSLYIPNCDTWVATNNGEIIGFISLTEKKLEALFVLNEYHGQGIGKRLLQVSFQERDALTLHVYQKNISATKFYEKHGFVISDSATDENTGEAEWIMTCENCKAQT